MSSPHSSHSTPQLVPHPYVCAIPAASRRADLSGASHRHVCHDPDPQCGRHRGAHGDQCDVLRAALLPRRPARQRGPTAVRSDVFPPNRVEGIPVGSKDGSGGRASGWRRCTWAGATAGAAASTRQSRSAAGRQSRRRCTRKESGACQRRYSNRLSQGIEAI